MNGMKLLFTDGEWQEVLVGNNLEDGRVPIVFDLRVDDTIQFYLTIEEVEELCNSLMKHIEQFKQEEIHMNDKHEFQVGDLVRLK